jgi:glutathione transport system substrate-binding protein
MSHEPLRDPNGELEERSLLAGLPSLSRRRLLQMAAGASALTLSSGLLAACGDDDDDDDDDDTGGDAATATEGDAGGGDMTATEGEDDGEATESDAGDEPTEAEDGGDATESDSGAGGEDPAYEACAVGGTLIYALSSDPPNMDPHIDTGSAAANVKMQIYTGLTRFWLGGEIEPDLAESFEISDDGLTYTFQLREGVVFHNGDPFTSADVKASFERVLDEATGATAFAELSAIESIDTPDDLTAVLNLSQASAPLVSYLADTGASIVSAAFLEGGGDPNVESIGTGPFVLDSREPGVRAVVVKNENYYREGLPYLDQIDFIPYADENTRMAAAFGGEVSLAEYVPWKDYQTIRGDESLTLHAGDAAAFMCVMYHTEKEPFNDPAVRYALGFAYDRQSMIDIVFFGEGSEITGGLVPPGLWGHNDALDGTFTYDPDRARELLAEAGYPDGFDAVLLSTSQYGMHQGTAEIVQQNLRDIGINCELELFDWPTVVERYAQGDFHFRIHGLGTGGVDPDTTLTQYFDSQAAAATNIAFQDDEVDRLLAEARALVDQAERKALYDQVQERLAELSPYSLLTYRVQAEMTKSDVLGYEHFPGGLGFESARTLEQVKVDCG